MTGGLTGRKQEIFMELISVARKMSELSDIRIGILYDTWHDEFNEEVPDHIINIVQKLRHTQ